MDKPAAPLSEISLAKGKISCAFCQNALRSKIVLKNKGALKNRQRTLLFMYLCYFPNRGKFLLLSLTVAIYI